MVLQVCTYVTGRSDRSITYAWFYRFVHMLLVDQIGGSHMHSITGLYICLLVDQIGGSHMHGSTILYICYW